MFNFCSLGMKVNELAIWEFGSDSAYIFTFRIPFPYLDTPASLTQPAIAICIVNAVLLMINNNIFTDYLFWAEQFCDLNPACLRVLKFFLLFLKKNKITFTSNLIANLKLNPVDLVRKSRMVKKMHATSSSCQNNKLIIICFVSCTLTYTRIWMNK